MPKDLIKKARLVVLISGSGTNLQAILNHAQQENFAGEVVAVISNNPAAYGLERAKAANVAAICLNHRDFAAREDFDKALLKQIQSFSPDLVILAGFMRVLSPICVSPFEGKMLNIHPSLLPKFPGLHTHERALVEKELFHGCTVHFVTAELDSGPIVAQGRTKIRSAETAEQLQARVQQLEYKLYPKCIEWINTGRLTLEGSHVYLDHSLLPDTGYLEDDSE